MPRQERTKSGTGIYHVMFGMIDDLTISYDVNMNIGRKVRYAANDYTADGRKLSSKHKTFVNGNIAVTTTDLYVDGLMLRNGAPLLWQFDGGYVDLNDNGTPTSWNYYVTDHLGSTRIVVDSNDNIKETISYYPFGSEMRMENPAQMQQNDNNWHPFRFTGKELDLMHGLNTYDYGARQYDPILCRWDRVDPLCEKYYNISPYAYCADAPINRFDFEGYFILFINGWNLGLEGGLSTYWGGFDKKIKEHFNDNKCRYYDGSIGGAIMTLVSINRAVRDGMGFLDGRMSVSSIIKNLARNKDGEIIEKLRVVSHSMGGAYAKGLVRAIVEYAENHPELCKGLSIDEYDFAPYQSKYLEAVNGVETFQYSHKNDAVAGNKREKGNVHYMKTSEDENDKHSIQDFIQYINSLQEGNYIFKDGQFIRVK